MNEHTLPSHAPPEVVAAFNRLTERRRALAFALSEGLPQKDAMLRAGFSKGQAKKCDLAVVGHPDVQSVVSWLATKAIAEQEVSVERLIREAAQSALADPAELFDAQGRMLQVHEMPETIRRAIAAVDVFVEYEGKGADRIPVGEVRKVKFWDKPKSIETIARLAGYMRPERFEVHHRVTLEQLVIESGKPAEG